MLTKSKITLALALVLGMASAATAATKHPVSHHQTRVERQIPAAAYRSFGSVARQGMRSDTPAVRLGQEPTYMYIQDQDARHSD